MNQNSPRGCAARGDEVYVEHTARARKCAVSAHFILLRMKMDTVPAWKNLKKNWHSGIIIKAFSAINEEGNRRMKYV